MLGESEILAFLPENFRFFFLVREFDTLDHVAAPLPAHDRGHAEPSAFDQGFRLTHSLQNNGSCARPVSVSIRKLDARHDAPTLALFYHLRFFLLKAAGIVVA